MNIAEDSKFDSSTEWLTVDHLQTDSSYNRPVHLGRVAAMVEKFDPEAIGVIYVSRRRNGGLYILDGQHRVEILRQVGWQDQKVPCLVYENLTIEDEARLFREMNEQRTKPRPEDLFRARLVAGDPIAEAINAVLERHGLYLTTTAGDAHIRAVRTVEKLANSVGIHVLDQTLEIINSAWGFDKDSLSQPTLTGIALLLATHKNLSIERLIEKLRAEHPVQMIAKMKYLSTVGGGSDNPTNFANVMIQIYNKGLRTPGSRLDEIKRKPGQRNPLSPGASAMRSVRRLDTRPKTRRRKKAQ